MKKTENSNKHDNYDDKIDDDDDEEETKTTNENDYEYEQL